MNRNSNNGHRLGLKSLGRYELCGEIARGNMGVVYRAFDPVIDRSVAIKTLVVPESFSIAQRRTFLARFFLGAKIAGKLNHPNIVVTFDAAKDDATETPFIVMELIEGESLGGILERQGLFPWPEAVNIGVQLAQALDYAHRSGIVHRRINPSNVILTKDRTPKIIGFGIAKQYTTNLTQADMVAGIPCFMSPEQLKGEDLDGRSDLFSLASLLYKIVVGRPAFAGSDIPTIARQVLYRNPEAISSATADTPPSLDRIMFRAMAKTVEARYPSTAEFAQNLLEVLDASTPLGSSPKWERTAVQKRPESVPPQRPTMVEAESALRDLQPTVAIKEHFRLAKRVSNSVLRRMTSNSSRRMWVWVTLISSIVTTGLLLFREEYIQHGLFHESRFAVEHGRLVSTQRPPQESLKRNPELEKAKGSSNEIDSEMFRQSLPLQFMAKHSHRLGSCTGRLLLHEWGVEYRSEKHGRWRWRFDEILVIRRDSKWKLNLRTDESDLLGLFKAKNHNFTMQNAPLRDEDWEKYYRLTQNNRPK